MNQLISCPKCKSENVVFSKKRGIHFCEDCEYEFTIEASISPLRIFLSYGHDHNEELVRLIKTDLENRGHEVWFDKNEIKFGDEWRRSITDKNFIRHLKYVLQKGDAFMEWTMQPVLVHIKPQITEQKHAFLSALIAAMSYKANMDKLNNFEEWRHAKPEEIE